MTLRFLKYVTCPSCQPKVPSLVPIPGFLDVSLFMQAQYRKCISYPTTRARVLKLSELRRARLAGLLVLAHAVDDVVLVQAFEEGITALPALRAGAAVGCYETAVL